MHRSSDLRPLPSTITGTPLKEVVDLTAPPPEDVATPPPPPEDAATPPAARHTLLSASSSVETSASLHSQCGLRIGDDGFSSDDGDENTPLQGSLTRPQHHSPPTTESTTPDALPKPTIAPKPSAYRGLRESLAVEASAILNCLNCRFHF